MTTGIRRSGGLVVAAMMALAGAAGMGDVRVGGETKVVRASSASAERNMPSQQSYSPQAIRGLLGSYRWNPPSYPNGPGWTCAHVKRMSRKRRNVVKHRARVNAKGGQ